MGEHEVLDRIAAWQAAGLIDEAIADRLRAAERAADEVAGVAVGTTAPADSPARGWLAGHGSLSLGELFGYLGAGFVVAAYYWMVGRTVSGDPAHPIGIAAGVAAVAFLVAGFVLRGGTHVRARASGTLMLVGGVQAWLSALTLLDLATADPDIRSVVAAAYWLAIAALAGRLVVGLPTRSGLLGASATAASAIASLARAWLFPLPIVFYETPQGSTAGPLEPLLSFGWFALVGVAIGWFAEREAGRSPDADDPSLWRRVSLTRFWAAMTVVVGGSMAIVGSNWWAGRGLEPYLGDALLLVASGAIAVVGLRVGSFAYMLPVGLGVFIALTDLNGSYIMDSAGLGPALLLEGVVLIAVGGGIELLRRRVAARRAAKDAGEERGIVVP